MIIILERCAAPKPNLSYDTSVCVFYKRKARKNLKAVEDKRDQTREGDVPILTEQTLTTPLIFWTNLGGGGSSKAMRFCMILYGVEKGHLGSVRGVHYDGNAREVMKKKKACQNNVGRQAHDN